MKKLNKKGFTLVEMLAVVAIIAVLVAIMIPMAGNAIEKAKAASNAANLRSLQAEILMDGEDGERKITEDNFYHIDAVDSTKGLDDTADPVTYDGLTAEEWAAIANGEEIPETSEGT